MRPGEIKIWSRMAPPQEQRGMVAILMLLILIIGGSYFLMGHLGHSTKKIEADKKTAEALAKAKEALIAWAVANQTTPGMFPYPDRGNDIPGRYDGLSDCPFGAVVGSTLLIGKLPVVGTDTNCLEGKLPLALNYVDGSGEVLWYAVSRNVVATQSTAPVINPDIRDNPPFAPWLVVRDRAGATINDKVVAVIIAPGPTLQVPGVITQNRNGVGPTAIEFLEGIPGGTFNSDYDGNPEGAACSAGPCEDFVMSEPYAIPGPPPPALPNPIIFNDRLIYITIDELLPLLEKRAAREARSALNQYYGASAGGFFPYAAPTGYPAGVEGGTTANLTEGFLPVPSCNCSCTSGPQLCTCSCVRGAQLSTTGAFLPASSSCTVAPGPAKTCSCAAIGVTAMGTCVTAANNITQTVPVGVNSVIARTGSVTLASLGTNTCNYTGAGQGTCITSPQTMTSWAHNDRALTQLPGWFMQNGWHWFLYYAIAGDCTVLTSGCPAAAPFLTIGTVAPVDAVVISAGRELINQNTPCSIASHPTQDRAGPSTNLCDYLDDIENTNGPTFYTDVRQPLTGNFNDQAVIVRP